MSDLIPPDDRFGETMRAPSAVPAMLPGSPGQGTMIEQARAVADVRAAIMIAREDPRIEADCVEEMRRACSMKEMAEVAFFRVKRGKDDGGGDNMVTGPTIDLANELSRCWRNINSGHKELSRNDQLGQSEVLAYAWDIEKNNRREQTIIIPHKRGKYRVNETQGIREVIAGVAARVEREMIFKVLPAWFRIQAIELCHETLAKGDGRSMEQRIADCKAKFYGIDIMADALERKIGRPAAQWTPEDIAILTVVFKSIRRGQSDAADEFPSIAPKGQPDNVKALETALAQSDSATEVSGGASSGSVSSANETASVGGTISPAGAQETDATRPASVSEPTAPVDPARESSPSLATAPGAQGGGMRSADAASQFTATAGAGEQVRKTAADGDAAAQAGGLAANQPPAASDPSFLDRATAALTIDGGVGHRWFRVLEKATADCPAMGDLSALHMLPSVVAAAKNAPVQVRSDIAKLFKEAALRLGNVGEEEAA
jgi:hypothetical protein